MCEWLRWLQIGRGCGGLSGARQGLGMRLEACPPALPLQPGPSRQPPSGGGSPAPLPSGLMGKAGLGQEFPDGPSSLAPLAPPREAGSSGDGGSLLTAGSWEACSGWKTRQRGDGGGRAIATGGRRPPRMETEASGLFWEGTQAPGAAHVLSLSPRFRDANEKRLQGREAAICACWLLGASSRWRAGKGRAL